MIPQTWMPWLVAAGIAAGTGLVGWFLGRLALRLLAGLVRRTATDVDDALIGAIRPHIPFLALVVGVLVGLRSAPADAAIVARVDRFALAAILFSVTLASASFLGGFVCARVARLNERRWVGIVASVSALVSLLTGADFALEWNAVLALASMATVFAGGWAGERSNRRRAA